MRRVLSVALMLLAQNGQAAISGTAVQCATDNGSGTSITVNATDGWSTPSSGNLIIHAVAINDDAEAEIVSLPASASTIQLHNPGNTFGTEAIWGWEVSDGDETTFTVTTAGNGPGNGWTYSVCEFSGTDLDLSAVDASAENTDNIISSTTSQTSSSATNTENDALVLVFVAGQAGNLWDNTLSTWSNSFSTQVYGPGGASSRPATFIGTKVVSSTGSQTSTLSTTDTGGRAYGSIAIFSSQAACAVDDASPTPGTTISISGCPAFAGNITTLTSPEGDTISAEAGANTTSASFIIPAETQFVSTGSMNDTRWGQSGTWTVGDGTTTENITLTVDIPAAYTQRVMACTEATNCPGDSLWPSLASGSVANDEAYYDPTSGTPALDTYGIPTGEGGYDFKWYDVSTTAWSAESSNTLTSDATAPVISSLSVSTNYGSPPDDDNLDVTVSTDEANGTLYWCFDTTSAAVDTSAEIQACSTGTGSNQSVIATGEQSFTSADLSDASYYVGVVHVDANSNVSNVLTDGPTVIDTTAPTITSVDITNISLATFDLDATFDDTATAYRYCSSNSEEDSVAVVANGVSFTPSVGSNSFTSLSGSGLSYCHFYQSDGYGNEALVSSNSFLLTSLSASIDDQTLTMEWSVALSVGAGGNGGFALTCSGGAVTATYSSGDGTATYVYSLSRSVADSETCTLAYTQPGNGLEESGGVDLPSFSGASVSLPASCAGVIRSAISSPIQSALREPICVN